MKTIVVAKIKYIYDTLTAVAPLGTLSVCESGDVLTGFRYVSAWNQLSRMPHQEREPETNAHENVNIRG